MLNADAPVTAVPGALWAVPDSAHASQGILLGNQRGQRGCTALSRQEERECLMGIATRSEAGGGEGFVLPSCQWQILHKVN